jgi:acyl carrier protein
MDYMDFSKIRNIIKKYSNEKDFENTTSLQALGIESIEYVQMIIEAEDMFGIEIDDDALILEEVTTVEAFIHVVENAINKKL